MLCAAADSRDHELLLRARSVLPASPPASPRCSHANCFALPRSCRYEIGKCVMARQLAVLHLSRCALGRKERVARRADGRSRLPERCTRVERNPPHRHPLQLSPLRPFLSPSPLHRSGPLARAHLARCAHAVAAVAALSFTARPRLPSLLCPLTPLSRSRSSSPSTLRRARK